jgi:hypothetical protein
VSVPLKHVYEAWGNKDKVQNNDQNDSDRGDRDCIGGYHDDKNTTETRATRATTIMSLIIAIT